MNTIWSVKRILLFILSALMLLYAAPFTVAAQDSNLTITAADKKELRLWYNTPATKWKDDSSTPSTSAQLPLPIGNGYMGGVIFGNVANERIQFNEKTMWTGGPGTGPYYNWGNKTDGANKLLPEYREHAFNYEQDAIEGMVGKMLGDITERGSYQNFGDLLLEFPDQSQSNVKEYVRDLDLQTAIAGVRYQHNGVNYDRKYFMSYPDKVMVIRLEASKSAMLTFDVKLNLAHAKHTKELTAIRYKRQALLKITV